MLVLGMCRWWLEHGISPFVVTLTDTPSDLAAEFRSAGIPVETMALPRAGNVRFPALALALFRLCRRLRPHAVLSMPLGWHAFMFAGARMAGVKWTAAHVGNYPPVNSGGAFEKFRFLVRLGQPVTDALICCSSYIEAGVSKHFGIPPHKTRVVYNGVEVDTVSRRAASARLAHEENSKFVVGMVATLEVHKDQPTLIRAAALLRDAGVPLEVWLVGEGSRRAEYAQLIGDLGLGDVVKMLGMRRDVPELLGRINAFVFSAKPDEGLGVALIEAMAAGVPIVATDVGACREVLLNGLLGKLVPEGDPEAMAGAIQFLTQNRTELETQLREAKRRAVEVFSVAEMATRYARCLGLEPQPAEPMR